MPAQPPFKLGQQNTQLDPLQEMAFRQWLTLNSVPFNLAAPQTDYDMRGFYQATQQQNPIAKSAVDPSDNRMHYPDYWKNPSHQTFSAESQHAGPDAPQWINDTQLAAPSGQIVNKPNEFSALLAALLRK